MKTTRGFTAVPQCITTEVMDKKNEKVKDKNTKYAAVPAEDPSSTKTKNSTPHPEEDHTEDPHHGKEIWTHKKIVRNLLVVSTAFFLLFTAFMVGIHAGTLLCFIQNRCYNYL